MNKRTLAFASLVLLLAVVMGAFGAHGLKSRIAPEALANWKTAVEYQFYHGIALLWLAGIDGRLTTRVVTLCRTLFLGGIILFCGSLALLATREVLGTYGLTPVLGPITPLGGLFFIGGWGVLFVAALRKG
ncbi:MAG: DUF423 domain-containing protein [Flavobacteriales bacterium]|nr:DUF423 domain-containing protein [Flavobacteriales bacterium]